MIDVEFYGTDRSSRAVVDAWKVYLDHLNAPTVTEDAWGPKREELLVDLLQKMAGHLDYHFDKSDIKRTSYFPRGYGDAEWEQQQIRRLLLSLLKGERSLPISAPQVSPSPGVQPPAPRLPSPPGGTAPT